MRWIAHGLTWTTVPWKKSQRRIPVISIHDVQYIPRNMHTVFALLCFGVVKHWLIFPYPSGLLHWHCGNLTIAPVPAKQPWWIWINTSCEFIMNDCVTTTKQSTTKPYAYFLVYTVTPSANGSSLWISQDSSQNTASKWIATHSVLTANISTPFITSSSFTGIFRSLKVL